MGKTTLQQAYIEREALLKKNEGATESSGAALSAVSGKNIRKAETAEVRISRNEQIAAQQNAARIASGAAAGAVTLEKARVDLAQSREHTRRNEILQMINQGIYDPAFAPELGYADDVVKQAAAEKNAARVKIKAAKAAAEKARREYEDYVAQLNAPAAEQAAPAVQKAEKPKNTQEAQTLLNRAAAQANNNLTGSTLAMAKNKVLDALGAVQRVEERHTGTDQAAEAAKKQEIAAALRAVSERYDQILEQRIAQKERAGKELEAPEQRYRDSAKRAVVQARQAVEQAESAEAKSAALEQYGITLNGAYRAAVTAATSALAGASLKYEAGAALNENEIETLKSQKARIAEMLDTVEREEREMRFDLDGQDVLKVWRENLETIGAALDAALDYGADYAGNEDAYRFMALDRMYGATPLAELEELLKKRDFAQNERFRIENRIRALENQLKSTRVRSASAWQQQEEMREELKALRARHARLQTGESDTKELENYIDRRKQEEAQAALIEQGRALLRDAAGGTLFEKFQALMDVTGENVRRYSWDPGEEWRDKNDVNTVLEDIKAFGENAKAAQDHRRAIAYAYHADLADYVDQLFTPAELEAEVRKARAFFAQMSGDEKVKWGRNVGFDYAAGRSESFKGNYEDFPRDLMSFAAGEYGDFTEDEAKAVLAVWQTYGASAAFDTYAALREGVTARRAQALQGWQRIAAGLVSGPVNFFTQGDDMIANALNPAGGYARIADTVFTKSHELNLIGIDNEALAGLYKLGYSVADMVPQVAIAAIPGVGAYAAGAYMYAKVFAQTYNESVAAGKRADEALVYGVIEASAEVAAEKLLGGIEGIASKAGLAAQIGKATEQIAASPRVQLLLRWAGNMGSEGFEEFVQEVCEPFFVKLASDLTTGEHSDLQAVDWAQAFESFAIGALTAGVIDGVAMIGDLRYSAADYEAARRALDDGSALSVIQNGRLAGSRLAEQLYRDIKAGRAVREGEGLRAFATEQDIMSVQKTYQSKLARTGKAEIATKLNADTTLAPKARRALNNVFSKILTGQKISVKEAADLINNPKSAAIMSRILGQNVETMLPNELAAAARLAAFTGLDGKATRERLALFRDAFGELDAAAITRIARYSDFAATDRVNNVLYEKGVRERLGDAGEDMELLLNALPAGMKYVVCDDLQTGAYPAYGVMAVNAADMNSAGMPAIGHETYNLLRRLDPARADFVRDFVLERAGSAEEIQEEIKIIRQQAAVDGRTFSEQDAREELAARLMPAVLMSGINVQKLAETNEPAANALRRAMEAAIRNADENTLRYSEKLNYREVADKIERDENFRIGEPFVKLGESVPQNLARILGIKGNNLIIKFSKLYAIIRKSGNIETKAAEVHYHGMGSDFAKNITRYLNDPEVVVQRGNGNYNIFFRYGKNISLAMAAIQLNQWKKSLSGYGNFDLILTAFETDNIYYGDIIKNENNEVIFDKKRTRNRKGDPRARYVAEAIKRSSFNNSISDFSENVNRNFYQTIFSDLTGSDLYDRLYDAIEWERQRESGIAYRGIIQSEADIEPVETEETDGGALERYNDLGEAARARYLAQRSAEIEAYLNERDHVLQEMAGEHETGRDKITTGKERDRRGMRERMKESIDWARRKLVDSGTAIAQIGKQIRDPHLYAYYNMARASSNAAEYMITTAQTDVNGRKVGESLYSIFAPILERGEAYYTEWQLYMYHMHNVDRMSRMQNAAVETEQTRLEFLEVKERYPELKEFSDKVIEQIAQDPEHLLNEFAREYTDARKAWERMQEIQNKPVFGYEVSADDSRLQAAMLEERNPEFKEYAEKVYRYNKNMMDYRVQSGLIDRETADRFEEIYPHYVPTGRVQAGDPIYRQENRNLTQVGRTIRKAVGGNEALASLYHQMEDQTRRTVREGSKNRFGARLLNAWLRQSNGIEGIREVQETADRIREMGLYEGTLENDTEILQKEKYKNVFSVYRDGVKWEMDVTPHLYEAVDVLSPKEEKSTGVQNFGKMTVNLFKKLVTGVNPFFIVKNFSRDFQDALIFSKDTTAWLRNYPRAWAEMVRNGELWQQYRALGGTFSSFFKESAVEPRSTVGKIAEKIAHNKVTDTIEACNELVEQAPRFAEFLATIERNGTSQEALMQAMANAADITVNFGRSGTTGNMLNKYWIPFFNPGVQGFSKAIRLFTETKGARAWLAVAMKAAALGFAPALVNALFHGAWGDDDEWDLIQQRDKDNYYLWRIQKGKWIKIPKGRMLAALGIPMNRVIAMCGGERPGWAEIWETGAEMVEQVAPANPITNNLLGPLVLTAMGKTWYGSDIESRRMQQYAPGKRYDTHTDAISKWLGSITNISPKKINYVLDAYTGVMGDLVLPMLTPAAELNIFKANFTIDTDYSNRLSGDFYKRLDTLKYAQNEVDATDKDRALYRFWNRCASGIGEINAAIRQIEEDASLSNDEKTALVREQYRARAALILSAEERFDEYEQSVDYWCENTENKRENESTEDYIYRMANFDVFGAEYALKAYGKSTYERAQAYNEEEGIAYETFYQFYFDPVADHKKGLALVSGGMNEESALQIARGLGALEPEQGSESVTWTQKMKAITAANVPQSDIKQALLHFGSDTEKKRITICYAHGVKMETYISVKEQLAKLNGTSGAKIQAAIEYAGKNLSKEQKAILWQILSSSTSAKNNPYSVAVGSAILGEKNH